ncbi:MAG: 5-formyltetrahydrofolate cyclo-ligase [Candidatus Odinarchaeota archaeon]|nr:5-formyltetrahydrofolate cyclo-ligase [Candidatus Odinarchaeota archaeon]
MYNTKKEIRAFMKKLRKQMSLCEVLEKSKKIIGTLFSLPEVKKAKVLLFYVAKDNEVQTSDAIDTALSLGKRVFIPITDKKTRSIKFSEIFKDWRNHMTRGAYNILEPTEDYRKIDEKIHETADVVVVPGLAFDEKCGRMGWGGGYYDKFLRLVSSKTIKIGLAYDFQVLKEIPMTERDQRVDIIVTEKRVIRCK